MPHAGHHEEAREVAGVLAAHLVHDALVVLDGVDRRDPRVGPAGIEQQLAAVRLELLEIGIGRVDEADRAIDDRHVAVEIERVPVVVRVLERPDPHGIDHVDVAGASLRRQRVADRLSREDHLTFAVLQPAVEHLDALELRGRQALVRLGSLTQKGREAECALLRVVQKALVERVAFLHHCVVDHLRLLGRDGHVGITGEHNLPRRSGGVHVNMAVGERPGDDAVVVLREPLRGHHRLASTGRASLEVRVLRGAIVERLDQPLRFHRRLVNGAIREVDDLLRVAERKHPVGPVGGVVASVGRRRRVAQTQRDLHVAVPLDRTGEPAIADDEQLAVPVVGRHPQLAMNVGVG